MMVRVPAPPAEAKAFPVSGSKPAPSVPAPVRNAAITFPVSAFMITIFWLSHAENRRRFLRSIANPEGPVPGTSGQRWVTFIVSASTSTISILVRDVDIDLALAVGDGGLGLPSKRNRAGEVPSLALIAVALALLLFMTKTRFVTGS